jgi:limonene-1,2-epoxide hydrolase
MSDWLRTVYDDADGLNPAAFAAHFTDDATFTLGNNPPMTGPSQVEAGLAGFFSTISGMSHRFTHHYTAGPVEVMEADVTYTLPAGHVVTVPGASVVQREGDKIVAMRSYIDLLPLFTAPSAAAL